MASIQGVYVALFGRPADPTGLAYFNAATNNGANLTAIGDLAATAEYKTKYDGKNNVEIVTAIYQQLFNRNPEATGLNFFVEALNKGTLNINNIAIAILDGAQGSDKTIVDAKIASAAAFTAAIDTPVEDASYRGTDAAKAAAAWIATITTTAATAETAAAELQKIVDSNFVGNTITPTAAIVALDGTTGVGAVGDVKTTTDKNDTINAGANWTVASIIDAGLGIDTLNASIAAANIVAVDLLKGVEVFKATATAAATLDVKEAKQLTEVWNAGSGANTLGVSNIAAGVTLGLAGSSTVATTFAFADTTGTSDVANLSVNTAIGAGGVIIAGVETLNITNEGTSAIGTVTAAAATAVNIAGKGSISLALGAGDAKTVTNTSTGTVTIDLSAAEKVTTYTGSAAIDAVTLDTNALTANVTINAGAGADTVTVNGGVAASAFSVTVNGGAGSDLFFLGTGTALNNVVGVTNADLTKSLVTIADFNKAEDSITYSNGTAEARAVLTVGEAGQISAQADLAAAITKAVEFREGTEDTFIFTFGTDTYIYTDVGADGLTIGDGLVKITGIAAADLTDANFTFV